MKLTTRLTTAMCIALLCLGAANLQGQVRINITNTSEVVKAEPIDDVLFTIQYETSFIADTLKPDRVQNETMMLKVGRKSSVYYSYARFLTDSIIEVDRANGASMEVIAKHAQQYAPKVSYKIYKNYPAGKLTYTDQLATNRFRCEEENGNQQWTLLPDTMTLLSYPCQKAICHFRGRTYEAWYTPEIPRSEGPWKLQGLPGLILKAQDTQGHYTFECTGIINARDDEKLTYSAQSYEPVSRKDLNKMYERQAADPIGFIKATAPNVTVVIRDESGQAMKDPKNTPYNPIER